MKTFKEICDLSDHNQELDYFYARVLDRAYTLPEHIPFVEIGTRTGGTSFVTFARYT